MIVQEEEDPIAGLVRGEPFVQIMGVAEDEEQSGDDVGEDEQDVGEQSVPETLEESEHDVNLLAIGFFGALHRYPMGVSFARLAMPKARTPEGDRARDIQNQALFFAFGGAAAVSSASASSSASAAMRALLLN
jgi:hypothetical protein